MYNNWITPGIYTFAAPNYMFGSSGIGAGGSPRPLSITATTPHINAAETEGKLAMLLNHFAAEVNEAI